MWSVNTVRAIKAICTVVDNLEISFPAQAQTVFYELMFFCTLKLCAGLCSVHQSHWTCHLFLIVLEATAHLEGPATQKQ